jgi:hypothetical protein
MPVRGSYGKEPDQIWARHGAALYALACAMTGNHAGAQRAITAGMTSYLDRVEHRPGPESDEALRALAPYVYRSYEGRVLDQARNRVVHSLPPLMTRLRDVARFQRTSLALCLFCGQSCSEAADLLGLSPTAISTFLRSGLRELEDSHVDSA